MNFQRVLQTRLVATVMVVVGTAGCGSEPPAPRRAVELNMEIQLPPGVTTAGRVYVSLFHAWSLKGELRHPLQLIESFEAAPGAVSHRFEYPENDGEGLIAFAWADVDGDGVDCTMTSRRDLSGLAEVPGFPADRLSVSLNLTEPCRGPDWFYPAASQPGPPLAGP
jgi:hypothetical protein